MLSEICSKQNSFTKHFCCCYSRAFAVDILIETDYSSNTALSLFSKQDIGLVVLRIDSKSLVCWEVASKQKVTMYRNEMALLSVLICLENKEGAVLKQSLC